MPYHKLNSVRMKEINEKAVLNAVCRYAPISRRALADHTGLTTATIANIVNELIAKQYLVETGQGMSDGGRKPQMIETNPDAGFMIGAELNTSNFVCILSDFRPRILDEIVVGIDLSRGKDDVIQTAAGAIREIMARNGVDRERVLGLGFVSAGPYDRERDVMVNPPNFPNWRDVDIRGSIERITGVRTLFERETPSIALGEYWFGPNSGTKRMLSINVYEIGLGGGLLIDGNIYHGYRDSSMEIGHMVVQPDGDPCDCGGRGCLEVQADGAAAVRYAREAIASGQISALCGYERFRMADVALCARQGDTVARDAIARCGDYLGMAMGNLCAVFSPDIVFLGGPFVDACPELFDRAVAICDQRPYPMHLPTIKKSRFAFGASAAAMGGIALVYSDLSAI